MALSDCGSDSRCSREVRREDRGEGGAVTAVGVLTGGRGPHRRD